MAVISDSDVTSMVRSLIGESSAEYWTDAEVTLYIKVAMTNVQNKYWYLLAPTDTKVSNTDLSASTAYVSLPTDCAKVLRVEVASNRKLIRKIESDELYKYSEYDDGAAASGYLNIWYLEYYDATTDFPVALRPLIAVEAVRLAKTKDRGIEADIESLQSRFESAALTFLASDTVYEPTIFGDYAQERSYTDDNPVAWTFRDGKIYFYKIYDED